MHNVSWSYLMNQTLYPKDAIIAFSSEYCASIDKSRIFFSVSWTPNREQKQSLLRNSRLSSNFQMQG